MFTHWLVELIGKLWVVMNVCHSVISGWFYNQQSESTSLLSRVRVDAGWVSP